MRTQYLPRLPAIVCTPHRGLLLALVALALGLASGLAACGNSSVQAPGAARAGRPATPARSRTGAARPTAAARAPAPDANMVSAVLAGDVVSPVVLKFRLDQPPRAGQPLHVALALVTARDVQIDHIRASFDGEGLQVQSGGSFDNHNPGAGAVLQHEVVVLPQQPGILDLQATLVLDSTSGSMTRRYAIPMIVSPTSGATP